MEIQNRIVDLRKLKKMTQEELALKVGVTRQAINAIENCKYVPSLTLAFAIAQTFKRNVNTVFFINKDTHLV